MLKRSANRTLRYGLQQTKHRLNVSALEQLHSIVAPVQTNSIASQHRSHSSYEYPLHTEAPIITRSLASDDPHYFNDESSSAKVSSQRSYPPPGEKDNFDDLKTIPPNQRQEILTKQRASFPNLLNSQPISPNKPDFLSSINHHSQSIRSTPYTELTTLPNGLRVASQETYGQVCTFGIVANCGSRLENDEMTMGCNHLLELLAFSGTTRTSEEQDNNDISARLDSMGGASFCNASREQFLYCIDVLRPNVDKAMSLLADVYLHPQLTEEDVDQVKKVVEYQWLDMLPEGKLGEGLQMAAYQPISGNQRQQLGRPHFCPLEALPNLNSDVLKKFRERHLLNASELVLAGAGIEHQKLVSLAEQHFGHLSSSSPEASSDDTAIIIPSTYTGGDYRQTTTTTDGFTRIALAFPTGGWQSAHDVLSSCVLQTLLGGGNSFSAGGPGKGMYSRLYRQVLNRYYWAESCEAFTSFHDESGLVGMSASSVPDKSRDVVKVLVDQFLRLERDLVEDEEFDRARNMLKCNVLSQLESRLVLFEDLGRQILTYGKREGTEEMCEKIDDVTKEDLRNLAKKLLRNGKDGKDNVPTMSVVGDRVDSVPTHLEVSRWCAS